MKNQLTQILLYPFSLLYGLVTAIRNNLFDMGVLKSTSFSIPVISIGNLSVGGTGKTPHTEYILDILAKEYKTAVLSRGYKRTTSGFLLADRTKDNALTIGDEPYQILTKFPHIQVAVDEKRVHGILTLKELIPDLKLIILDDAFQHRYVKPGLSILLTDMSGLYSRDRMLPSGNLREWASGSKRADIIIVTKCPPNLPPIEMRLITGELDITTRQHLFFSSFSYKDLIPVFAEKSNNETLDKSLRSSTGILFAAGIVKPEPAADYLKPFAARTETLFYPDHYDFKAKDFAEWETRINKMTYDRKLVIVTEKDAARIKGNSEYPEHLKAITYALPIGVSILQDQESLFIQKIKNYVIENTRNS